MPAETARPNQKETVTMRVLLPIDGSDCSNQTLHWAADTFNKAQARYFLLFVIPVLPDLNTVEYDIVEASAMLRKAKNIMESQGCLVERAEYVLGDTIDQICRYADEIDADQIVLGSHGRTGLSKLLMALAKAASISAVNGLDTPNGLSIRSITANAFTFFNASTICGPGNGRNEVIVRLPVLWPRLRI